MKNKAIEVKHKGVTVKIFTTQPNLRAWLECASTLHNRLGVRTFDNCNYPVKQRALTFGEKTG